MDDILPVQMVYADESGKLMLHHPSLSEIKSQLPSSGPDENYKNSPLQSSSEGFIWDLVQM